MCPQTNYRNKLKIAAEKLAEVVETYHTKSPMNYAHSAFALALTFQVQGKTAKATKICEEMVIHAVKPTTQICYRSPMPSKRK